MTLSGRRSALCIIPSDLGSLSVRRADTSRSMSAADTQSQKHNRRNTMSENWPGGLKWPQFREDRAYAAPLNMFRRRDFVDSRTIFSNRIPAHEAQLS